jgi:hypothetical protein
MFGNELIQGALRRVWNKKPDYQAILNSSKDGYLDLNDIHKRVQTGTLQTKHIKAKLVTEYAPIGIGILGVGMTVAWLNRFFTEQRYKQAQLKSVLHDKQPYESLANTRVSTQPTHVTPGAFTVLGHTQTKAVQNGLNANEQNALQLGDSFLQYVQRAQHTAS